MARLAAESLAAVLDAVDPPRPAEAFVAAGGQLRMDGVA